MVFPAPAGVILLAGSADDHKRSFPRTCGGDPDAVGAGKYFVQFSPHLRG